MRPLLVVGLDGADLGLVERWEASLPVLSSLRRRGLSSALRSTLPFATLPAWTSILTATPPGVHGVFDFTERKGYRVRFTGGRARRIGTTFRRMDAAGLVVALLGFPGTYPPEPFAHGICLSGWDSPVAFEADATFAHPRSLHRDIVGRFGPLTFDDVDEFDGGPGWHEGLAPRLCARIARKRDLFLHLYAERGPWDVFACYFGETDTAAHHLWALSDDGSPRRPAVEPAAGSNPLRSVYEAADEAVGALRAALPPDADVLVLSDHGFGGASDEVVYLNRLLARAGLLTFRRTRLGGATRLLKEAALRGLPPRLREHAFRAAGTLLPSLLESSVRFGGIDFDRTQAFSEELPYAPSVWLNLEGREPRGTVRPGERERVLARVIEALGPAIAAAHPRETVHAGPAADRAPDLLLELAAPSGYTLCLQPSSSGPPDGAVRRRLRPDEHLGRKGAPLSGSHRREGLLLGNGPGLAGRGRVEMDVVESGLLIAALAGLPSGAPVHAAPASPLTRHDEAILARRLQALGYLD